MAKSRACYEEKHLLQTTALVAYRDNGTWAWAHFLLQVNDMSMFLMYNGEAIYEQNQQTAMYFYASMRIW